MRRNNVRRMNTRKALASLAALLACGLSGAASMTAQTASPALIVLNKEEGSLAIIDPAAMKVVGRVPTGEAPHEVTVSDDGKLAFVANYGARAPGIPPISTASRRGPRAFPRRRIP